MANYKDKNKEHAFHLITKDINEAFVLYIADLPEFCQLIIICSELDKKTKIYKEASKHWNEYEFDSLEENDLKKFIEKRFKASGKIIKKSLVAQIVNCSGYYDKESNYNLYNLENDVKKIIHYSQDQEVETFHITESISGNIETNVYQMIDAISSNKKDEAFELLHDILQAGENLYYILAVILSLIH